MREFYHSVFIRVNTGQWKPIFSHNYAMNTQILAYASNNIKKIDFVLFTLLTGIRVLEETILSKIVPKMN